MKKRIPGLLWLLMVTAVLIAALGIYLKYVVLRPVGLYQDEWAVAVPFLLMGEEEERDALLMALTETEETVLRETDPPETEPMETEAPETQPPETEEPTEEPTESPTELPTEEPTAPPAEPPTEPIAIDESWFDDALFIGDSRTEGLAIYARLGDADYFCKAGMTVYNVQEAYCSDAGYQKTSLSKLLSKNSYGKVYINLGLNEVGYDHDRVLEKYQELIDLVQKKQPDAVIVLQGIMTVSRDKAKSASYFHLDHIEDLNDGIKTLADGKQIHYIDVNEWIADEEGYLPDDLSNDGCHLLGPGYTDWSNWLMDNAATLEIQ